MSTVTLTLGRDGMGELADEADFDAWVIYVCDRIDTATGLTVEVEERGKRDVQTDRISGDAEHDEQAVRDALIVLWEDFCADTNAWPKRNEVQP